MTNVKFQSISSNVISRTIFHSMVNATKFLASFICLISKVLKKSLTFIINGIFKY